MSSCPRWRLNNWEIKLLEQPDEHYSLVGGNLVVSNPDRSKHTGKYVCVAQNVYGIIISKEATVRFGYLNPFPTDEREGVQVKEGQGAVLLCAPPERSSDDVSFRWILNEFPVFIPLDNRRFVSQTTGNLYIARVDASDSGNYSCFMSSPSISKSVFSQFIPLIPLPERPVKKYPADIRVKFPKIYALVNQNITLECFALGNPIPEIRWRKVNAELPANHEVTMGGALLHIFNIQIEDEGYYECEALNSKGKDWHKAYVYVEAAPEWAVHINNTEKDIGSELTMTCIANGKPEPYIRWLKNGFSRLSQGTLKLTRAVLFQHGKGELKFSMLTFEDSGMYQCIAENRHGSIYANAELRVIGECHRQSAALIDRKVLPNVDMYSSTQFPCVEKLGAALHLRSLRLPEIHIGRPVLFSTACAPNFENNPVRKRLLGAQNGRVVIECKPKAAPKPKITWSKGTEVLYNSTRIRVWDDGSLEIFNATKMDEGRYTCFAENDRGKANSTGTLTITGDRTLSLFVTFDSQQTCHAAWFSEATKITVASSSSAVRVGEPVRMQCAASHDPILDIAFIWALDTHIIDFDRESEHYQLVMISNTQLKHAGRYTCTAQTIVDNVTVSADLVVKGPPGPPGAVRVDNIRDKMVTLVWSRGADNHSPIIKYIIQSRDQFSLDREEWKDANTSPPVVQGNEEMTNVVDLYPWAYYEFRAIAINALGMGEPSLPSIKIRTYDAVPTVAPSDIGGGSRVNGELTITWTPVQPQYYNGWNFGYVVAFKAHDKHDWTRMTVADPEARRYVYKDSSIPPNTEFQVKVKAYNSKGDGPYSLTAVIYSAQDGKRGHGGDFAGLSAAAPRNSVFPPSPAVPSEAPTDVVARPLSATEAMVWWLPVFQQIVEGYQVKYWRKYRDNEAAAQRILVPNTANQTLLENMRPDSHYLVEVRAYNAAGLGPPSIHSEMFTRKAPPSRPPRIVSKTLSFTRRTINIAWEHVSPLANESYIEGYKVLYRKAGHRTGALYTTGKHYIDLPVPKEGNYIVEVRAHSEGGDGAISRVWVAGTTLAVPLQKM
ncbi:contactin-1-like [Scleropages formosus]|uniref:Contactin-1-like n=1 Tax=Scleropages formosus TaxID=113540 RepID=A0A0P7UJ14_SCLFO|nr:contactin-1-like [Scleropages formosus]